jgi:hypothetical protein
MFSLPWDLTIDQAPPLQLSSDVVDFLAEKILEELSRELAREPAATPFRIAPRFQANWAA